jgi:hypothetical protein
MPAAASGQVVKFERLISLAGWDDSIAQGDLGRSPNLEGSLRHLAQHPRQNRERLRVSELNIGAHVCEQANLEVVGVTLLQHLDRDVVPNADEQIAPVAEVDLHAVFAEPCVRFNESESVELATT